MTWQGIELDDLTSYCYAGWNFHIPGRAWHLSRTGCKLETRQRTTASSLVLFIFSCHCPLSIVYPSHASFGGFSYSP